MQRIYDVLDHICFGEYRVASSSSSSSSPSCKDENPEHLEKKEAKAPEDICNLCETKIKGIYEHLQSNGIMSHVLRIKMPELIHFRSQLAR